MALLKLFSRGGDDRLIGAAPTASSGAALTPGQAARRALVDQIGAFLARHDIAVTPATLTLAHAAFSGSNLRLAERIAQQETTGQPIDHAWLEHASDDAADAATDAGTDAQRRAEVEHLITRLDVSLGTFCAAASRAQGATADYGETLAQQVELISRPHSDGEIVAGLVGITRTMIERTRELEQDMRRSAGEAATLRLRLDRAQHDAAIDHLTGLPNRRAFEGLLDSEYREAQRQIENLSVAFCDIDRFKLINDNHGHETGDRVIQAIAQVLARISDERCHVARHGGEEFVVLFRGKSVAEATVLLDDARIRLAERSFVNRTTDQTIGQITFSGGVADAFAYPDPRDALRAADEALYRAKAEGRNRICAAV